MHAQAHKLVGMNIQKVESKKRGLVVEVKEGFMDDLTTVVFADGYKGAYQDKDILNIIKRNGKHNHNCE